jgi:hypothetical protein
MWLAVKTNTAVALAVFLVVNIPPWFGFSYLFTVFLWATFQDPLTLGGNLIFPITYASALLTLGGGAYLFRKRMGLSWMVSLLLGTGLATAGAGLFELTWQGVGYLFYPAQITGGVWLANYVLNGSWIFLSFGSIRYWRVSRRFLMTGTGFVAGWIVWVALGFPQVFQSANILALIMNSSLKVGSFALFLCLVIFDKEKKPLLGPKLMENGKIGPARAATPSHLRLEPLED